MLYRVVAQHQWGWVQSRMVVCPCLSGTNLFPKSVFLESVPLHYKWDTSKGRMMQELPWTASPSHCHSMLWPPASVQSLSVEGLLSLQTKMKDKPLQVIQERKYPGCALQGSTFSLWDTVGTWSLPSLWSKALSNHLYWNAGVQTNTCLTSTVMNGTGCLLVIWNGRPGGRWGPLFSEVHGV